MSIAIDIIKTICAHEAAHGVVARALCAQLDVIEVFNIGGDGIPGAGSVAKFWHPDLPVFDLATITVAGEAGERILECVKLERYPLAKITMEKGTLPKKADPNSATQSGLIPSWVAGDGGKFINRSTGAGITDHLAFLLQCQEQAAKLLRENMPEFIYRVADLTTYAMDAKVHERIPADGISDDGPHWYFKYPGKPLIDSIREAVLQWMWFHSQKRSQQHG